ncbi:DUF4232 domain-containing protein [Nocardiopsis ansamitocini]|uniref:DUF4232 domain-containing protein n=1 Tax=Nocardiopsis ansamitocini TaxID=1670832 RepID=A0A9W6UID1_9ACTN|nr:DUF4232 domain-containing protein [Nocardiopsis ansamitocini]GLU49816.1 hypothetical protein Nans01_41670 [Nocardiopsis ansamitocini]
MTVTTETNPSPTGGRHRWAVGLAVPVLVLVGACGTTMPEEGAAQSTAAAAPSTATTPTGQQDGTPASSEPGQEDAAASACTSADVAIELGGGDAGAGSVNRDIVVTDTGATDCTLNGYPGLAWVDADGNQIGGSAERDGSDHSVVTLSPGDSATASYRQANPLNFPKEECDPTDAAGLQVILPETDEPFFVRVDDATACAGDVGAPQVRPFVAG